MMLDDYIAELLFLDGKHALPQRLSPVGIFWNFLVSSFQEHLPDVMQVIPFVQASLQNAMQMDPVGFFWSVLVPTWEALHQKLSQLSLSTLSDTYWNVLVPFLESPFQQGAHAALSYSLMFGAVGTMSGILLLPYCKRKVRKTPALQTLESDLEMRPHRNRMLHSETNLLERDRSPHSVTPSGSGASIPREPMYPVKPRSKRTLSTRYDSPQSAFTSPLQVESLQDCASRRRLTASIYHYPKSEPLDASPKRFTSQYYKHKSELLDASPKLFTSQYYKHKSEPLDASPQFVTSPYYEHKSEPLDASPQFVTSPYYKHKSEPLDASPQFVTSQYYKHKSEPLDASPQFVTSQYYKHKSEPLDASSQFVTSPYYKHKSEPLNASPELATSEYCQNKSEPLGNSPQPTSMFTLERISPQHISNRPQSLSWANRMRNERQQNSDNRQLFLPNSEQNIEESDSCPKPKTIQEECECPETFVLSDSEWKTQQSFECPQMTMTTSAKKSQQSINCSLQSVAFTEMNSQQNDYDNRPREANSLHGKYPHDRSKSFVSYFERNCQRTYDCPKLMVTTGSDAMHSEDKSETMQRVNISIRSKCARLSPLSVYVTPTPTGKVDTAVAETANAPFQIVHQDDLPQSGNTSSKSGYKENIFLCANTLSKIDLKDDQDPRANIIVLKRSIFSKTNIQQDKGSDSTISAKTDTVVSAHSSNKVRKNEKRSKKSGKSFTLSENTDTISRGNAEKQSISYKSDYPDPVSKNTGADIRHQTGKRNSETGQINFLRERTGRKQCALCGKCNIRKGSSKVNCQSKLLNARVRCNQCPKDSKDMIREGLLDRIYQYRRKLQQAKTIAAMEDHSPKKRRNYKHSIESNGIRFLKNRVARTEKEVCGGKSPFFATAGGKYLDLTVPRKQKDILSSLSLSTNQLGSTPHDLGRNVKNKPIMPNTIWPSKRNVTSFNMSTKPEKVWGTQFEEVDKSGLLQYKTKDKWLKAGSKELCDSLSNNKLYTSLLKNGKKHIKEVFETSDGTLQQTKDYLLRKTPHVFSPCKKYSICTAKPNYSRLARLKKLEDLIHEHKPAASRFEYVNGQYNPVIRKTKEMLNTYEPLEGRHCLNMPCKFVQPNKRSLRSFLDAKEANMRKLKECQSERGEEALVSKYMPLKEPGTKIQDECCFLKESTTREELRPKFNGKLSLSTEGTCTNLLSIAVDGLDSSICAKNKISQLDSKHENCSPVKQQIISSHHNYVHPMNNLRIKRMTFSPSANCKNRSNKVDKSFQSVTTKKRYTPTSSLKENMKLIAGDKKRNSPKISNGNLKNGIDSEKRMHLKSVIKTKAEKKGRKEANSRESKKSNREGLLPSGKKILTFPDLEEATNPSEGVSNTDPMSALLNVSSGCHDHTSIRSENNSIVAWSTRESLNEKHDKGHINQAKSSVYPTKKSVTNKQRRVKPPRHPSAITIKKRKKQNNPPANPKKKLQPRNNSLSGKKISNHRHKVSVGNFMASDYTNDPISSGDSRHGSRKCLKEELLKCHPTDDQSKSSTDLGRRSVYSSPSNKTNTYSLISSPTHSIEKGPSSCITNKRRQSESSLAKSRDFNTRLCKKRKHAGNRQGIVENKQPKALRSRELSKSKETEATNSKRTKMTKRKVGAKKRDHFECVTVEKTASTSIDQAKKCRSAVRQTHSIIKSNDQLLSNKVVISLKTLRKDTIASKNKRRPDLTAKKESSRGNKKETSGNRRKQKTSTSKSTLVSEKLNKKRDMKAFPNNLWQKKDPVIEIKKDISSTTTCEISPGPDKMESQKGDDVKHKKVAHEDSCLELSSLLLGGKDTSIVSIVDGTSACGEANRERNKDLKSRNHSISDSFSAAERERKERNTPLSWSKVPLDNSLGNEQEPESAPTMSAIDHKMSKSSCSIEVGDLDDVTQLSPQKHYPCVGTKKMKRESSSENKMKLEKVFRQTVRMQNTSGVNGKSVPDIEKSEETTDMTDENEGYKTSPSHISQYEKNICAPFVKEQIGLMILGKYPGKKEPIGLQIVGKESKCAIGGNALIETYVDCNAQKTKGESYKSTEETRSTNSDVSDQDVSNVNIVANGEEELRNQHSKGNLKKMDKPFNQKTSLKHKFRNIAKPNETRYVLVETDSLESLSRIIQEQCGSVSLSNETLDLCLEDDESGTRQVSDTFLDTLTNSLTQQTNVIKSNMKSCTKKKIKPQCPSDQHTPKGSENYQDIVDDKMKNSFDNHKLNDTKEELKRGATLGNIRFSIQLSPNRNETGISDPDICKRNPETGSKHFKNVTLSHYLEHEGMRSSGPQDASPSLNETDDFIKKPQHSKTPRGKKPMDSPKRSVRYEDKRFTSHDQFTLAEKPNQNRNSDYEDTTPAKKAEEKCPSSQGFSIGKQGPGAKDISEIEGPSPKSWLGPETRSSILKRNYISLRSRAKAMSLIEKYPKSATRLRLNPTSSLKCEQDGKCFRIKKGPSCANCTKLKKEVTGQRVQASKEESMRLGIHLDADKQPVCRDTFVIERDSEFAFSSSDVLNTKDDTTLSAPLNELDKKEPPSPNITLEVDTASSFHEKLSSTNETFTVESSMIVKETIAMAKTMNSTKRLSACNSSLSSNIEHKQPSDRDDTRRRKSKNDKSYLQQRAMPSEKSNPGCMSTSLQSIETITVEKEHSAVTLNNKEDDGTSVLGKSSFQLQRISNRASAGSHFHRGKNQMCQFDKKRIGKLRSEVDKTHALMPNTSEDDAKKRKCIVPQLLRARIKEGHMLNRRADNVHNLLKPREKHTDRRTLQQKALFKDNTLYNVSKGAHRAASKFSINEANNSTDVTSATANHADLVAEYKDCALPTVSCIKSLLERVPPQNSHENENGQEEFSTLTEWLEYKNSESTREFIEPKEKNIIPQILDTMKKKILNMQNSLHESFGDYPDNMDVICESKDKYELKSGGNITTENTTEEQVKLRDCGNNSFGARESSSKFSDKDDRLEAVSNEQDTLPEKIQAMTKCSPPDMTNCGQNRHTGIVYSENTEAVKATFVGQGRSLERTDDAAIRMDSGTRNAKSTPDEKNIALSNDVTGKSTQKGSENSLKGMTDNGLGHTSKITVQHTNESTQIENRAPDGKCKDCIGDGRTSVNRTVSTKVSFAKGHASVHLTKTPDIKADTPKELNMSVKRLIRNGKLGASKTTDIDTKSMPDQELKEWRITNGDVKTPNRAESLSVLNGDVKKITQGHKPKVNTSVENAVQSISPSRESIAPKNFDICIEKPILCQEPKASRIVDKYNEKLSPNQGPDKSKIINGDIKKSTPIQELYASNDMDNDVSSERIKPNETAISARMAGFKKDDDAISNPTRAEKAPAEKSVQPDKQKCPSPHITPKRNLTDVIFSIAKVNETLEATDITGRDAQINYIVGSDFGMPNEVGTSATEVNVENESTTELVPLSVKTALHLPYNAQRVPECFLRRSIDTKQNLMSVRKIDQLHCLTETNTNPHENNIKDPLIDTEKSMNVDALRNSKTRNRLEDTNLPLLSRDQPGTPGNKIGDCENTGDGDKTNELIEQVNAPLKGKETLLTSNLPTLVGPNLTRSVEKAVQNISPSRELRASKNFDICIEKPVLCQKPKASRIVDKYNEKLSPNQGPDKSKIINGDIKKSTPIQELYASNDMDNDVSSERIKPNETAISARMAGFKKDNDAISNPTRAEKAPAEKSVQPDKQKCPSPYITPKRNLTDVIFSIAKVNETLEATDNTGRDAQINYMVGSELRLPNEVGTSATEVKVEKESTTELVPLSVKTALHLPYNAQRVTECFHRRSIDTKQNLMSVRKIDQLHCLIETNTNPHENNIKDPLIDTEKSMNVDALRNSKTRNRLEDTNLPLLSRDQPGTPGNKIGDCENTGDGDKTNELIEQVNTPLRVKEGLLTSNVPTFCGAPQEASKSTDIDLESLLMSEINNAGHALGRHRIKHFFAERVSKKRKRAWSHETLNSHIEDKQLGHKIMPKLYDHKSWSCIRQQSCHWDNEDETGTDVEEGSPAFTRSQLVGSELRKNRFFNIQEIGSTNVCRREGTKSKTLDENDYWKHMSLRALRRQSYHSESKDKLEKECGKVSFDANVELFRYNLRRQLRCAETEDRLRNRPGKVPFDPKLEPSLNASNPQCNHSNCKDECKKESGKVLFNATERQFTNPEKNRKPTDESGIVTLDSRIEPFTNPSKRQSEEKVDSQPKSGNVSYDTKFESFLRRKEKKAPHISRNYRKLARNPHQSSSTEVILSDNRHGSLEDLLKIPEHGGSYSPSSRGQMTSATEGTKAMRDSKTQRPFRRSGSQPVIASGSKVNSCLGGHGNSPIRCRSAYTTRSNNIEKTIKREEYKSLSEKMSLLSKLISYDSKSHRSKPKIMSLIRSSSRDSRSSARNSSVDSDDKSNLTWANDFALKLSHSSGSRKHTNPLQNRGKAFSKSPSNVWLPIAAQTKNGYHQQQTRSPNVSKMVGENKPDQSFSKSVNSVRPFPCQEQRDMTLHTLVKVPHAREKIQTSQSLPENMNVTSVREESSATTTYWHGSNTRRNSVEMGLLPDDVNHIISVSGASSDIDLSWADSTLDDTLSWLTERTGNDNDNHKDFFSGHDEEEPLGCEIQYSLHKHALYTDEPPEDTAALDLDIDSNVYMNHTASLTDLSSFTKSYVGNDLQAFLVEKFNNEDEMFLSQEISNKVPNETRQSTAETKGQNLDFGDGSKQSTLNSIQSELFGAGNSRCQNIQRSDECSTNALLQPQGENSNCSERSLSGNIGYSRHVRTGTDVISVIEHEGVGIGNMDKSCTNLLSWSQKYDQVHLHDRSPWIRMATSYSYRQCQSEVDEKELRRRYNFKRGKQLNFNNKDDDDDDDDEDNNENASGDTADSSNDPGPSTSRDTREAESYTIRRTSHQQQEDDDSVADAEEGTSADYKSSDLALDWYKPQTPVAASRSTHSMTAMSYRRDEGSDLIPRDSHNNVSNFQRQRPRPTPRASKRKNS